MQCPTCQVPLRAIDYEGIRIDSCNDCGGTWLDAGEFKQIIRAREVRFDPDERRAVASAAKGEGVGARAGEGIAVDDSGWMKLKAIV